MPRSSHQVGAHRPGRVGGQEAEDEPLQEVLSGRQGGKARHRVPELHPGGASGGGRGRRPPRTATRRRGPARAARGRWCPAPEDLQRPETLRTLESCLAQHCTQNLRSLLFHTDFKKHCAAVEVIASLVEDESSLQGVLDNLDLVLQWFAIRICEGNMQVLVKILTVWGVL